MEFTECETKAEYAQRESRPDVVTTGEITAPAGRYPPQVVPRDEHEALLIEAYGEVNEMVRMKDAAIARDPDHPQRFEYATKVVKENFFGRGSNTAAMDEAIR